MNKPAPRAGFARGLRMLRTSAPVWMALSAALSGCLLEAGEPDGPEPEGEPIGQHKQALTVVQAASAGGCSTTAVFGLSEQIIKVVNCLKPGIYVKVSAANMTKSSSTFPYLEKPAADKFVAALKAKPSTTMQVSSMLRTVASQYLLYHWYINHQCGIPLAASPGKSNHESGLAADLSNYSTWISTLENHSFDWYGSSDKYHFTYVGSGAVDLRSIGIRAFQKLWNYNHPEDKIAEDGAYGPQTEARLKKSPATGFSKVPACSPDTDGDGVVDAQDNCDTVDNASQTDTDKDGKGDACDTDDDGDGKLDTQDNCPKVKNETQTDTDKDGKGDACDTDDDGDGKLDTADNCPKVKNASQLDTDKDGKGDACDDDDDGDGVLDSADNCPLAKNPTQADADGDGKGDACEADNDNDGVVDADDNCPNVANPEQADADGDGKGDACETDDDGDGTVDTADNCPTEPNPEQSDADKDGIGDACDPDIDGDAVGNEDDLCPNNPDPKQADQDKDGKGDACDDDRDGDGIANDPDNCPDDDNPDQLDTDKDGVGDVCAEGADGDEPDEFASWNNDPSSASGSCGCRQRSGAGAPLGGLSLGLLLMALRAAGRRRRQSGA